MKRYHFDIQVTASRQETFEGLMEDTIIPLLTSFDNVVLDSDYVDNNGNKKYRFNINDMNNMCFLMVFNKYYGDRFDYGLSTNTQTGIEGLKNGLKFDDIRFTTNLYFDLIIFSQNNKLYGLAITAAYQNPRPDSKPLVTFYKANDIPYITNTVGFWGRTYISQEENTNINEYASKIYGPNFYFNKTNKVIMGPVFQYALDSTYVQGEIDIFKAMSNVTIGPYAFNEIVVNGEKYYQTGMQDGSTYGYNCYIKGGDE